jgi:hypothetical protein
VRVVEEEIVLDAELRSRCDELLRAACIERAVDVKPGQVTRSSRTDLLVTALIKGRWLARQMCSVQWRSRE